MGISLALLALPALLMAAQTKDRVLAAAEQAVTLGANPVQIHLKAPAGEPLAVVNDARVLLVLRDLSSTTPPGVVFAVYFDLPKSAGAGNAAEHLVGYLNFFNDQGSGRRGTRSFDVTDLIRGLKERNLLTSEPTVTIEAAEKPAADAQPVIGRAELIERR